MTIDPGHLASDTGQSGEDGAGRFFIITGGPGSGKSSLIDELSAAGFPARPEAGRAIIQNQAAIGGQALPWGDRRAFAEMMLDWELASFREAAALNDSVFFDRGLPDVIGYLQLCGMEVAEHVWQAARACRYDRRVFLAPPWYEIYCQDEERKQSWAEAVATAKAMVEVYKALGYEICPLPLAPVRERAAFVLNRCGYSLKGGGEIKKLPKFKYIPDPVGSGIFDSGREEVCSCCGQNTDVHYHGSLYTSMESPDCLCPECIHSGKAAEKYQGDFHDTLYDFELVKSPEYTAELSCRTPAYIPWQAEYWPAHCDDYCAFVNYVGWKEIAALGLGEADLINFSGFDIELLKEGMANNGSLQGYLFQCLKCGQFLLYADCD